MDIGGKIILAGDRHAHAEDRFHNERIGARGSGAVHVRELHHEIVDAVGLSTQAGHARTSSSMAYGMRMVDFCMSQAAVGQRSAHNPQCTHTSSSFTITRAVCGRAAETYSACFGLVAGAVKRVRKSGSAPFWVMVRQSTGQMSIQASHSMHSFAVNTVCTSQFRQRCTSRPASSAGNPSSTSMLIFLKRSMSPTSGTKRRSTPLYSFL